MRSLDHLLGEIVPRMTEAHWRALAYIEKYGLLCADAFPENDDLNTWGLVHGYDDNSGIVYTTDLGDLVLEEEPSLAGY